MSLLSAPATPGENEDILLKDGDDGLFASERLFHKYTSARESPSAALYPQVRRARLSDPTGPTIPAPKDKEFQLALHHAVYDRLVHLHTSDASSDEVGDEELLEYESLNSERDNDASPPGSNSPSPPPSSPNCSAINLNGSSRTMGYEVHALADNLANDG